MVGKWHTLKSRIKKKKKPNKQQQEEDPPPPLAPQKVEEVTGGKSKRQLKTQLSPSWSYVIISVQAL